MSAELRRHTSLTKSAHQRLRDLHVLLVQYGVPKGIPSPPALTLSAVVEIVTAMAERELKKGKRR